MRIAILCRFPLNTVEASPIEFSAGQHATSWLVDLPEAFARLGSLEIHWITLSDQVEKQITFPAHGGTFYVLPTTKKGRATTFYLKDRQRIQACLQRINPNVVHGWGTEDVYGWATIASGFPHVLSMQGIMSHLCLKGRMHLRERFQALLEMYCLKKAQMVTVESEWGAEILQRRRGNKPIEVVEYGVRKSFYEVSWSPQEQNPYAIFIGTLHPRKGIEDLVEAFSSMGKTRRLKVIGTGDAKYVSRLERRSTDNIEWLGGQPLERVQKEMTGAWCLVLPTRADTSPNVVKEARVIGLPVLTTASGGQSAYLVDGEDGFLIEPGNVEKTRERLLQILGDYQQVRSFGDEGRRRYREIFRPEKTATGFLSIYHELLRRNPT
jgi:glycosyltransferase involved in cell wall biosynthesis